MQSPKWLGRCPDCGAWESFVEEVLESHQKSEVSSAPAQTLRLEEASHTDVERIPSGMEGMNRLLGGGWVPGSVVLIGGEPGVGKSTLMLQLASQFSSRGSVFYISGEESPAQVAMRARRLGVQKGITLVAETALEPLTALLEKESPALVVVDSIQTILTGDLSSAPGSVSQVRAVTSVLSRMAKAQSFILVIVGHVTKEGAIAGPRTLEHMVDVVLYFEGDLEYQYRMLRSHKNRYGSTFELVVFEMTEGGLKEQDNPSRLFLAHRDKPPVGTAITAVLTGTQPLLLEVQALTVPTPYPTPRRTTVGLDINRLHLLTAVMIRHGLNLGNLDIYANVAGGFPIRETGADLALVAAVASSLHNRTLPENCLFVGEVGLTGEIRPVPRLDIRLKEAKQQGFTTAYTPAVDLKAPRGLTLKSVDHINAILKLLR